MQIQGIAEGAKDYKLARTLISDHLRQLERYNGTASGMRKWRVSALFIKFRNIFVGKRGPVCHYLIKIRI